METWTEKADKVYCNTKEALELIYNELNNGQRNKLLKNEKIKELLERYKII